MSIIPPYTLIRSSRRTLSIQIRKHGEVIVRAPRLMPRIFIEHFIEKKIHWINQHIKKVQDLQPVTPRKKYSQGEVEQMKKGLGEYLTQRIPELWNQYSLPEYNSIKVTKSEGRWGSCSAKNGLCFSYRLAEYLPRLSFSERESLSGKERDTPTEYDKNTEFIDAVIVHELAHLREKNHQKPFWNLVYSMMPEYESVIKKERNTRRSSYNNQ